MAHGPPSNVSTAYAPDGTPIGTEKTGTGTYLGTFDKSGSPDVVTLLRAILQEARVQNQLLQITLGYTGELDALRSATSNEP